MLSKWSLISIATVLGLFVSGCSTAYKARQDEKAKVAGNSGLYCEFVNGDAHNDVDVELTLQMSKKCDMSRPYTITNYKNASDIFGIVFCCGYGKGKTLGAPAAAKAAPTSNDGLD